MNTRKIVFMIIALVSFTCRVACAKILNIVTTTADLASITEEIGKDKVRVSGLMDGTRDPHFTEPRPSMLVKIRNADLVIAVGMDLDMWIFSLMDAARNPNINVGKAGYLDASVRIQKLEVQASGMKIDASMGDVHPLGNPHYWLDPENGKVIAETIARKLGQLSPSDSVCFAENLKIFNRKIDQVIKEGKEIFDRLGTLKVITYHRSFPYFARRFDLSILGELESKPGIPPSPSHLARIIKTVKEEKVDAILMEVFYNRKAADFVAGQTGTKVIIIPNSVGGTTGAGDYFSLFETIFKRFSGALGGG